VVGIKISFEYRLFGDVDIGVEDERASAEGVCEEPQLT